MCPYDCYLPEKAVLTGLFAVQNGVGLLLGAEWLATVQWFCKRSGRNLALAAAAVTSDSFRQALAMVLNFHGDPPPFCW